MTIDLKEYSIKMEVILAPIGGGKTSELIYRSSAEGSIIVCADYSERDQILSLAQTMGKQIPEPIPYMNLTSGSVTLTSEERKKGILIDNLDTILGFMFPFTKVKVVTFLDDKTRYPMSIRFHRIDKREDDILDPDK
jgi:hypothetical protein